MTHNKMFSNALWVSPNEKCENSYFRGRFFANIGDKAVIQICGLGLFELFINGKKISDDLFAPGWTNYVNKPWTFWNVDGFIEEKMTARIIVMQYDISEYLRDGDNIIGIALGSGFYGYYEYGREKLCYKIDITNTDGNKTCVISDSSLKWNKGAVTKSNFTLGEEQDLRLEQAGWQDVGFCDDQWCATEVSETPDSNFVIGLYPTDKVIRKIAPVKVWERAGRVLYDCGENITGWPVLKRSASAGEMSHVVYGEELLQNGEIDNSTYAWDSEYQEDKFILAEGDNRFHTRFTWHAFRYFTVESSVEVESVEVVHSDVPISSDFECSDQVLNWIYKTYLRTQLDNMHLGIPSDCPHRERRGYTGDGQLTAETAMLCLDAKSLYLKWIEDISDCQNSENGHIQYTAPFVPSGGGPGGWGCAIVVVPYEFYKRFGDITVLAKYYPQMLKYFEYLEAHSDNDLITSEEPWAWCLGDWCTPEDVEIPEPFVNNYYYIKSLTISIEIAHLIGKHSDIPMFTRRIEQRKQALIREYFNSETGSFSDGVQGADAFAVDIEIGDERTFENLIRKYTELKTYDTGIFGTEVLNRLLFERGYDDLAFDLITSHEEISYRSIMNFGATTLYEYWKANRSHNHPMFGAVVTNFFKYILGIKQVDTTVGYERVIISPKMVNGLQFAKGHIQVSNGKIAVEWKKKQGKVYICVDLSGDVTAELNIMSKTILLNSGKNEFVF